MARAIPIPVTLNIKDTAAVLGVTRNKVYKLIEDGHLAVHRLDGTPRVRIDDIERLLGGAPIQVQRTDEHADAAAS